MENKKAQGFNLAAIGALATLLVVAIVTAAVGARIVNQVDNTFDDGTVAANATFQGLQGMQQFAEFLPIIGLIVVSGVVLSIVRRF